MSDFGAADIMIIGVLEGLFPPVLGLLFDADDGGIFLTTPLELLLAG